MRRFNKKKHTLRKFTENTRNNESTGPKKIQKGPKSLRIKEFQQDESALFDEEAKQNIVEGVNADAFSSRRSSTNINKFTGATSLTNSEISGFSKNNNNTKFLHKRSNSPKRDSDKQFVQTPETSRIGSEVIDLEKDCAQVAYAQQSLEDPLTSSTSTSSVFNRHPIHDLQPTSTITLAANRRSLKQAINMERDVVVNSNSLEDVALSEMSDNRAQSIQSLNSVEAQTPETTPSFDELQQRLENSNRNIQNMQEQQQELLRLQDAAKQHLNDMESVRQQAGSLSFSNNLLNGTNDGAPDYESIGQVHEDMDTLVKRMKNLNTFIQQQNELSNMLGDNSPEIIAEQRVLQEKLESLRTQRNEMRDLVNELQDVNRSAENTVKATKSEKPIAQKVEEAVEKDPPSIAQQKLSATNLSAARVVPVTYARTVPIQLSNGVEEHHQPTAEVPANMSKAIEQKMNDIATMRNQLKRLKDMMETVNMIEARTGVEPKDNDSTPQYGRSQSASTTSSCDRERTPIANMTVNNQDGDGFIARKVRLINEVTSDLRAQAENLQTERDRIKALKEEIVRRKRQAAAAVQLGEDALLRNSLTPTPTPMNRQKREESPEAEDDNLKSEYDARKKQFERLCEIVSQEETGDDSARSAGTNQKRDIFSEADDEADMDEELNDSDFCISAASARKYYQGATKCVTDGSSILTQSTPVVGKSGDSRLEGGQESLESTINSSRTASSTINKRGLNNAAHEGVPQEAASTQSGSSHSYSIPPPMAAMGGCSSWPPMPPTTWNPHFYYGLGIAAPPNTTTAQNVGANVGTLFTPPNMTIIPTGFTATMPVTAASGECICSTANSGILLGTVNGAAAAPSFAGTTAAQLSSDPVLLQQFVQTQQMLINSVCQCNQMLWHQQREIDALNNTVHTLQDRIYSLTGGTGYANDVPFNLRAETVPPHTSGGGALPNNLYTSANRAQSEQPGLFISAPPGNSQGHGAFTDYQQHQHHYHHRQRGGISTNAGGFSYSSETQQQQAASNTNTSIYTTLNNAAPAPPVAQAPHYNNETPQSPLPTTGPGPIFMHHHNNAIHQNNANLRTQNHYANNLQHQQSQHAHNNIAGNTLNNQVPPGNRANNYWDNFRSYSRQNLLSTNSNKSNEEQQSQNLDHNHQQLQNYLQQQHRLPTAEQLSQYRRQPQRPVPTTIITPTLLGEDLKPQYRQRYRLSTTSAGMSETASTCNNLNYDRNTMAVSNNNKYLQRTAQRSHINQHHQEQQNIVEPNALYANNNLYQSISGSAGSANIREYAPNSNWINGEQDNTNVDSNANENNIDLDVNHYNYFNIVDSDLINSYSHLPSNSINLRNMNVNIGNSPHYQRNKVLVKPTVRVANSTDFNHNHRPLPELHFRRRNVDVAEIERRDLARNMNFPVEVPQRRIIEVMPCSTQRLGHLRNRERERIDMLLRTATDSEEHNTFMNANASPYGDNQPNAMSDIPISNEMYTNYRNGMDDDDTTSEEIKRNLLVNALKSDKFTTKFYESIKEDVFRALESILMEKSPSTNCQRTADVSNNIGNRRRETAGGTGNAVNGFPICDPMRAFSVNTLKGNQQKQPHRTFSVCSLKDNQPQQKKHSIYTLNHQLKVEIDNRDGDQSEPVPYDYTRDLNNADTESNNGDNNEATAAIFNLLENDKPEDDEVRCNMLGACGNATPFKFSDISNAFGHPMAGTHWRRNIISDVSCEHSKKSSALSKKRRNLQGFAIRGQEIGAEAPAVSNCIANAPNSNGNGNRNYYLELIANIITRIRNETHSNTQVNDTLLVEIAKMTANAISHNRSHAECNGAVLVASPPLISPKRIYAKMKKTTLPRNRDQFLAWYETYLETLFLPPTHLNRSTEEQEISQKSDTAVDNVPLPPTVDSTTMSVTENIPRESDSKGLAKLENSKLVLENILLQSALADNSNVNKNNVNLHVNDEDLAEADQNSANTNDSTNNIPSPTKANNTTMETAENNSVYTSANSTGSDFENIDHPDVDLEEGAAGGSYVVMSNDNASTPDANDVNGDAQSESTIVQENSHPNNFA